MAKLDSVASNDTGKQNPQQAQFTVEVTTSPYKEIRSELTETVKTFINSPTLKTLLLLGSVGSGKSFAAKLIHQELRNIYCDTKPALAEPPKFLPVCITLTAADISTIDSILKNTLLSAAKPKIDLHQLQTLKATNTLILQLEISTMDATAPLETDLQTTLKAAGWDKDCKIIFICPSEQLNLETGVRANAATTSSA